MNPSNPLLATALASARAAAGVHANFAGRVRVEDATEKGASDFVSHVDLQAQEAALEVIRTTFPGHEILSEEEDVPRRDVRSGVPQWIVDPLDGTTNFLHGHPAYAASVGVVEGGKAVAGAVVAAATDECWWGAEGMGAFRNHEPIRVSTTRQLRFALVGTGFPFKSMDELPEYLGEVGRLLPACSGIRRGGSAALDLCYLAQGSLDAFWETRLDPWDVAAGVAILSESGGVVRRRDRGPFDFVTAGSVLAANSEQLLGRVAERLDGA